MLLDVSQRLQLNPPFALSNRLILRYQHDNSTAKLISNNRERIRALTGYNSSEDQ